MSASDEEAAALATTLTATVTKTLSRNAELQVSSQAAVDRVSTLDPLSAGERLKVRALLRGTIKPDRGEAGTRLSGAAASVTSSCRSTAMRSVPARNLGSVIGAIVRHDHHLVRRPGLSPE